MTRHSFFQRLFQVVTREENGRKEKKYDWYKFVSASLQSMFIICGLCMFFH